MTVHVTANMKANKLRGRKAGKNLYKMNGKFPLAVDWSRMRGWPLACLCFSVSTTIFCSLFILSFSLNVWLFIYWLLDKRPSLGWPRSFGYQPSWPGSFHCSWTAVNHVCIRYGSWCVRFPGFWTSKFWKWSMQSKSVWLLYLSFSVSFFWIWMLLTWMV